MVVGMTQSLGPRIQILDPDAPRLDPEPLALEPDPAAPPGTAALLLAGGFVLMLGTVILGLVGFAQDQFTRAPWLGWTTLAVAGLGLALVLAAMLREWRALRALHQVDRLRAGLASPDPAAVMAAARDWSACIDKGALLPALGQINDPDAALALLRAGPAAALRNRASALGQRAALQIAAAIAAVPSPAFDALLVAWRGLRLIRQVAALYGLRPGLLATLSLLRRAALSASVVGATDLAANLAAQAVLGSPLLAHAIGDAATAAVAARRMVILARATAAACDPLLPDH